MIKRRAKSIDVALRTRTLMLYLFQRRIAPRISQDAARRVARQICRLGFGQSKIEQSDLAAGGNFQIVRFDVAMNNLAITRVQIDEPIQQLISPGNHLISWKLPRLLRNNRRQVSAGDELHNKERPVSLSKVIADARQCRMIQTGQEARFLLELAPETVVDRESFFQSHDCIQTLIDCFIYGAHSAFTKLPNNPVAALQNSVGLKRW